MDLTAAELSMLRRIAGRALNCPQWAHVTMSEMPVLASLWEKSGKALDNRQDEE